MRAITTRDEHVISTREYTALGSVERYWDWPNNRWLYRAFTDRERELCVCEREATAWQAVIVAHNHPSGSTQPSAEDDAVTKRLVESGRLLGLPVLDHVIVTEDGYYSYKQEGRIGDERRAK